MHIAVISSLFLGTGFTVGLKQILKLVIRIFFTLTNEYILY